MHSTLPSLSSPAPGTSCCLFVTMNVRIGARPPDKDILRVRAQKEANLESCCKQPSQDSSSRSSSRMTGRGWWIGKLPFSVTLPDSRRDCLLKRKKPSSRAIS